MTIKNLVTVLLVSTSMTALCQSADADSLSIDNTPTLAPIGLSAGLGPSTMMVQSVAHFGFSNELTLHAYSYRLRGEYMLGGSGFFAFFAGTASSVSLTALDVGKAYHHGNVGIIPYAGWQWQNRTETSYFLFSSSESNYLNNGPTLGLDVDFFTESYIGLKLGVKACFGSASSLAIGLQMRIGKGKYHTH